MGNLKTGIDPKGTVQITIEKICRIYRSQQGASQLSRILETRLCPGCRQDDEGHGGSCSHAHNSPTFSLIFTTKISLEIATNLRNVTKHVDGTQDEMEKKEER